MLQIKQVKRVVIVFLLLTYSNCYYSQNYEIKDSIYRNVNDQIFERKYFSSGTLVKKEVYTISYTFLRNKIQFIHFDLFDFVNANDRYGFSWNKKKGVFMLSTFTKYKTPLKVFDFYIVINMNNNDLSTIGSVNLIKKADGLLKNYEPGEYYYDFPADPDSIFNVIPKELGLPDTLLHIQYKQPWME